MDHNLVPIQSEWICSGFLRCSEAPPPPAGTHLSRDSSQRGSWGSSYSETPDSMGEPLEERREGRTSMTPEWMEELESTDTCRKEHAHYFLFGEAAPQGEGLIRVTGRRGRGIWE